MIHRQMLFRPQCQRIGHQVHRRAAHDQFRGEQVLVADQLSHCARRGRSVRSCVEIVAEPYALATDDGELSHGPRRCQFGHKKRRSVVDVRHAFHALKLFAALKFL